MSDIDLDKALDVLADYADLVWDATDMQDNDSMTVARTHDATHARCRHCGTIVCAFAPFELQPLAQRHLAETHGEDAS